MSERFNELVDGRPYVARGVASALFAVAALCFLLPFVRAVSDLREGRATGLQFVTGDGELSGHYVHDAYEGETEAFLERGRVPAIIALAATLAGIGVAWIPWRSGAAAAFSFALVAPLGLGAVYLAAGNQYEPAVQDWRYGFWLAAAAQTLTVAWTFRLLRATPFWWGPPAVPPRDYFASRDSVERSPATRK